MTNVPYLERSLFPPLKSLRNLINDHIPKFTGKRIPPKGSPGYLPGKTTNPHPARFARSTIYCNRHLKKNLGMVLVFLKLSAAASWKDGCHLQIKKKNTPFPTIKTSKRFSRQLIFTNLLKLYRQGDKLFP